MLVVPVAVALGLTVAYVVSYNRFVRDRQAVRDAWATATPSCSDATRWCPG